MDINAAFPSNYLKASDLAGQSYRLVIDRCENEQITDGEWKPILYFSATQKGLVLNKTNAYALAAGWGPETNNWKGREVELYPDTVMFQGKPTP